MRENATIKTLRTVAALLPVALLAPIAGCSNGSDGGALTPDVKAIVYWEAGGLEGYRQPLLRSLDQLVETGAPLMAADPGKVAARIAAGYDVAQTMTQPGTVLEGSSSTRLVRYPLTRFAAESSTARTIEP